MIDVKISSSDITGVIRALGKSVASIRNGLIAGPLRDIGFRVQRDARRNCPLDEGALTIAIDFEVREDMVRVFVPSNSQSGTYAEFIHDGSYRLGEKSMTKNAGGIVGPKFIQRAIKDNEGWIEREFGIFLDKKADEIEEAM